MAWPTLARPCIRMPKLAPEAETRRSVKPDPLPIGLRVIGISERQRRHRIGAGGFRAPRVRAWMMGAMGKLCLPVFDHERRRYENTKRKGD